MVWLCNLCGDNVEQTMKANCTIMTLMSKTPSEQRNVFSENLRQLIGAETSIATLSRALEINRTQLNRYLGGESFPRPDVLKRICDHFNVDARILVEPLSDLEYDTPDPITNSFVRDYIGAGIASITEDTFPSGFYRFSRRSFVNQSQYLIGLVHIRRVSGNTYMKGFETKSAMQAQNLPSDSASREFRGVVMQQDDGLCILASRQNTLTCSFNYLSRVASFQNNFWVGYVTRTVPENDDGLRATRMVYEYLGTQLAEALPAARSAGFWNEDDLLPYHRRLLRVETPFW
jgi:transcriptional regulator with XRE-family HTH domain